LVRPGRLPEEANLLLETTDTPFGKAVQALKPFRRTIEVRILWSPLPQGWETKSSDALAEASNEIRDVSIRMRYSNIRRFCTAPIKSLSRKLTKLHERNFQFEIKARP